MGKTLCDIQEFYGRYNKEISMFGHGLKFSLLFRGFSYIFNYEGYDIYMIRKAANIDVLRSI